MSFYRIYSYPGKADSFKHVYIRRDRGLGCSDRLEPAQRIKTAVRFDESVSRTRRLARDLMLCNTFQYFCTFTFSAGKIDRYDYSVCKSKLTKFFNNYRQRYSPDFRYLLIPEQHDDGAWHFHGVVRGILESDFVVPEYIRKTVDGDIVMVPNTPGYVAWARYEKAFGWFNCSAIQHYEKCANYITKYITKEMAGFAAGAKVILASKDLQRPELVYDEDNVPFLFEPQYKDEFCMMSYCSEDETVGKYLPEWYGECCSDLKDETGICEEKLTFEQLKWSV